MKKSYIQLKSNRTSVLCHKTQCINIQVICFFLCIGPFPVGKQSTPSITLVPLLYRCVYFITLVTFVSHRVHGWSRPLKILFPQKPPLYHLVLWNLTSKEDTYCSVSTWFLHIPSSQCVVFSPIKFYHQILEGKIRVW